MDKEMMEKINEMLKARPRRELTEEETESVSGGAPETVNLGGITMSRMEFLEFIQMIHKEIGRDVALDLLLEGIHNLNFYRYSDDHITGLYLTYGATEGFWAMMDRVGF